MKQAQQQYTGDLAGSHHLIGDLFHQPANAEEWKQYVLTEDKQYR